VPKRVCVINEVLKSSRSCQGLKTLVIMSVFVSWLCVGYAIRICLIVYGIMQDSWMSVPYTDVDYLIFSGAAKHVVQGGSPYDEPTYRYPPLLAWLLTPNLLIPAWGKILFSTLDIGVRKLTFVHAALSY